jgi:FSR family fosmidomycin resistance protein-like MFS transporter
VSLPSVPGLSAVEEPRQVGLVSGAHGVNEFYSTAIPPVLPLVVSEFDVSIAEAGLLVTAYFAMYAIFQLPAGYVADRVGGTRLVAVGLLVLAGGTLGSSLAPTFEWLVVGQVVAGIGGSTYHPAGMSLVSDVESTATEGTAMGVHGVAGTAGTLLAPLAIGGAATVWDWRTALAGAAVVGVGYAVVFALFAREPAPNDDGEVRERAPTDDEASAGDDSVSTGRPDGGTAGDAGGWLRSHSPVPLATWVLGLFLLKFLFTLQSGAVRTYAVAFVFDRTAGATGVANAAFAAFLAGTVLATMWFGGLADRYNRRRLAAGAFLLSAAALAVTAVVPTGTLVLGAWFFCLGVAVYAALPVVNTLTSQHARREFSGGLFGVVQTASALGSAVSPALFGAVAGVAGIGATLPAAAVVALVAAGGLLVVGERLLATG